MFFNKSCPISLILVLISISITVLVYLQFVDIFQIYYHRDLIFRGRQFWRLFTSILSFGSPGLSTLAQLFSFAQQTVSVENSFFSRRPADFLIFCIFGMIVLWVFGYFYPTIFLGPGFVSFFMYYSAKRSPDAQLMLFLIPVTIKAPFAPLILLTANAILKNWSSVFVSCTGYLAAHTYFFLHDIIPLKCNVNILSLPESANMLLNKLFSVFL